MKMWDDNLTREERRRRGQTPRALWLFLLLPALGCSPGESGQPDAAKADIPTAGDEAVVRILKPVCQKHDLPAMAGAVVTSRGLRTFGAVGVRKRGEPEPVTAADKWHLGSDTKAMTATLVGRLVERELVKWETAPAEVFPELASSFHRDYQPVTILHLLTHRAGVVPNLRWSEIARKGTLRAQRIEAVKQGLGQKPEHVPGSKYLYSNLGYVIVGAMLERITDKTWEELMRREIFEPLKMETAGFGGLGTPGQIDQPWGHLKGGKPVRNNGAAADNPPVIGPAGTVHATVQDWARYIADLLKGARGEPALLKESTYRKLLEPQFGGDYGLGWLVAERSWGGGTVFNHCGCNTMYYANVWVAPKRDFAVLVCANQGLDAFKATDDAVSALIHWHNSGKNNE